LAGKGRLLTAVKSDIVPMSPPDHRKEKLVAPRIAWVEEESATGRTAELYARQRARSGRVADIVKTFSVRPEALEGMLALSAVHFGPDSALTRAQREMIATHVSALLECRY
jgi:alkylhydroperoxidase family enzyme